MDELMDMIMGDESPSQISDKIKELLYVKAGERVDALRPEVADVMFNTNTESEEE